MIHVILRDGRVLRYNDVNHLELRYGEYTLRIKKEEDFFCACFPMDVVERIETVKPCQVMKDKRNKKKMPTY